MSPQVRKTVRAVPEPSVKRYPKSKTKPAMWRAWAYVRLSNEDTRAKPIEGTSTLPGDAGKAEALSRFRARAAEVLGTRDTTPTVRQMAESWLEWRTLRESSRATYRTVLATSLAPLHDRPVTDVTPGELFDHLSSLSPGAVRSAYALLRGAFSRAVGLGLITTSPATKDVVPQRAADSAKVMRRLTVAEVEELRELFRAGQSRPRASTPIYTVTELMLRTGARIGEVLALQAKHIERDVNLFTANGEPDITTLIYITGTQVGNDGNLRRQEHVKTGPTGRRRVKVSEAFYREHLAPLLNGKSGDDWLFEARRVSGRKGTAAAGTLLPPQMVSASNLRTAWRNLIRGTVYKRAEVTPHTYRRTVAQALVDDGKAELASALLGHSTATTLFRSYADRPVPVVDPSALLDEVFMEYRGPQTEAEWEALYDDFDAVGPTPKRQSRE
ncbi:MAG: site-specific integrase [Microbacterium sp.]|uniref:tyrosine-type recombinase/integrase n=1 Tax=Microbacterium sp. TaxID=51671 RepID=UPI0019A1F1DD|nr:site-specific integrase [Microbacterium sp.]MBD3756923.1 site-specific integrase [Microbacterium sp.]